MFFFEKLDLLKNGRCYVIIKACPCSFYIAIISPLKMLPASLSHVDVKLFVAMNLASLLFVLQ